MSDQQSFYELAGWGTQPAGMGYWGDAVTILTITTTRDQTGKARITVTTQQAQTGKARITATTLRTQPGITKIAIGYQRDQTGKTLIAVGYNRTQTGVARIVAGIDILVKGEFKDISVEIGKMQVELKQARMKAVDTGGGLTIDNVKPALRDTRQDIPQGLK